MSAFAAGFLGKVAISWAALPLFQSLRSKRSATPAATEEKAGGEEQKGAAEVAKQDGAAPKPPQQVPAPTPEPQANASIFVASSKSAAVTPPSEWVESETVTLSQEISRSGWWFISSAGATRLWTKLTEPTKSPRLNSCGSPSPLALPAGMLAPASPRSRNRSAAPSPYASTSGLLEAMSDSHPTLWQIDVSHYSEKARWALAWKGVEHRRHSPPPGAHMIVALWLTRGAGYTFPMLSWTGARSPTRPRSSPRSRSATPSRRSTPPTPTQRRRALELEDFFDEELGPYDPPARLARVRQRPRALPKR